MQYCTVASLKSYLDVDGTDDDVLLSYLIDTAGAWLDREARRVLATDTDTTVYMDSMGHHIDGLSLHVSDFGDLSAITSVVNGDGITVTAAQYTTYPKTLSALQPTYHQIKLLTSANLSWTYTTDWENAISITGRWAMFAADTIADIPADIAQNAKLVAAFMYRQKDPGIFETIAIPDAGIINVPRGFPTSTAYWIKKARKP
jgi:hypothetical protein